MTRATLPTRRPSETIATEWQDRVMASKALPSPEVLRQLLRYEPETGKLFWLPRGPEWFSSGEGRNSAENKAKKFNALRAGRVALDRIAPDGYRVGILCGKSCSAHRAAFALSNGFWPPEQIDHVNGDRSDNRLDNLRAVSGAENGRNQAVPITNTSGVIGVYWHPQTAKWRARIVFSGKHISLGLFASITEAATARKAAEAEYGFHENHGRAQ